MPATGVQQPTNNLLEASMQYLPLQQSVTDYFGTSFQLEQLEVRPWQARPTCPDRGWPLYAYTAT